MEGGGQAAGKFEEPRTPSSSSGAGGKVVGSADVSPLRMGSPWEEKGKWEVVNRLLRMEGYRPIDLEGGEAPNTSELIKIFMQVCRILELVGRLGLYFLLSYFPGARFSYLNFNTGDSCQTDRC